MTKALSLDYYIPHGVYCKPMKHVAREVIARSGWLGIALLGLAAVVSVVLVDVSVQVSEEVIASANTSTPKSELTSSTTKLKYVVVGQVEAKKEIIIRAKQAGTVEEVMVAEGSLIKSGGMLALQMDPVLSARLNRQEVASSIAESERESALLIRVEGASLQAVNHYQATGLANLTNEASTNRALAIQAQLVTNLETIVVSLPEILRFVQDNKTYFGSESNSFYREAVSQLYGKDVDYLKLNNLTYPGSVEGSLINSLAKVTTSTSLVEMLTVTNQALLALSTLVNVFTESESEFLDRNRLSSTEEAYTGYNVTRQNLLALKLALEQSSEALVSVSDTGVINEFKNEVTISQSEITKATALEQSKIAQALLTKTGQLSRADRAVLEAELSLGLIKAPFAGVVSEVLVEVGEYVQPGTPLFVLISLADQELEVRVPGPLLSRIKVGSDFMVDDKVIGRVDRIVPVLNGGSASVYLALDIPFAIGQTLRGELELVGDNKDELMISRRELFFSAHGPYIKTNDGKEVAVSIVLDEGETLLVVPEEEITTTLLPATGIRL